MTVEKSSIGFMMKQESQGKNGLVSNVSTHLFGMFKSGHDANHAPSKTKSGNESVLTHQSSMQRRASSKEPSTTVAAAPVEKQSNSGKNAAKAKGKRLEELRKLMVFSPTHPTFPANSNPNSKPNANSSSNSPLESPRVSNGSNPTVLIPQTHELTGQDPNQRTKEDAVPTPTESPTTRFIDHVSSLQENNSESSSNSDSELKESTQHSGNPKFLLTLDDFALEKHKKTDALLANVIDQLSCPTPNLRRSSSFSSLVLPIAEDKNSESEESARVHPYEDKPRDKSPLLSPFCKSPANGLKTPSRNSNSEEFEFRALGNEVRPLESKSQPCCPASSSGSELAGSSQPGDSEIKHLVRVMGQGTVSEKRMAAESMRNLSKVSSDIRAKIGEEGGISFLIEFLKEEDPMTVEHAVTALLNLALDPKLKKDIVSLGAIEPVVQILSSENSTNKARENAAGAICTLSVAKENRGLIRSSGAIPLLIQMLGQGSTRGKKDAAIGLFNLSIESEGRFEIADAGAIQSLVGMLTDGEEELEDDIIALITSLTRTPYACKIMEEEGTVAVLVGALDGGSPRGKFNAVVALLNLANSEEAKQSMWEEGAIPVLVGYSNENFARGKEQALALLKILRDTHS